jgi:hypothetical protein
VVRRTVPLLILLVLAATAIAVFYERNRLIDRFAPFDIEQAPGILTSTHLWQFEQEPDRCFAALRQGGDVDRVPPRPLENGCGYSDGATLRRADVSHGGNLLLRCPAMVSLLLWERHVVGPAAARLLGLRLTGIRHLGTYSCRNINHAQFGRRSQHANANAIDIAGFTLAGGTTITVLRDWNDTGAKGEFLHAVRDGACKLFNVVLSPDYNAAHRNHFHLDRGDRRACR